MGRIDQDRTPGRDALLNPGVQPFLHLVPVALDHRVAVELLTDPIRGEELRIQQWRQQLRNGGLPARWRSNQEVAAQGGGHEQTQDVRIMGVAPERWPSLGAKNQ